MENEWDLYKNELTKISNKKLKALEFSEKSSWKMELILDEQLRRKYKRKR